MAPRLHLCLELERPSGGTPCVAHVSHPEIMRITCYRSASPAMACQDCRSCEAWRARVALTIEKHSQRRNLMGRISAYMQVSLDGYFAGPNGEIDWFKNNPDSEFEEFSLERARGNSTLLFGR